MDKTAIVFPGQASQYVGMGKDLYEASEKVRKLYETASNVIGEDIAKISFNGPEETLKRTRFTQPAILLHSLAVLTILGEDTPLASVTAGHSLGEYGAHALAGVMSFEEAILAVVKRASLMEDACVKNPSTMAAVMGLNEEKITEICKEASVKGIVVPANFNSAVQIVISGTNNGVEDACRLCKEAGAKRAMVLQVGGAFHSPLMEPAQKGMEDYLASVDFSDANINIIPNVTASAERDPNNLKKLLVSQLTAPVKWYQTLNELKNFEIDTFIEIGPGKVLTGLAKRELKGVDMMNIDTLEDIEKLRIVAVG